MKRSTIIWISVSVLLLVIVGICIWGAKRKGPVDKWANAPGTSGFINLDEVQKAAIEKPKTEDFEKRVNEIFEGDNLILLDIQGRQTGFVITGVEDLNKNGQPDVSSMSANDPNSYMSGAAAKDEVVFQLTVKGRPPNNATLVGGGVNRDFRSTFNYPMPVYDRAAAGTYYKRYGYYPYPYYYFGFYGPRYRYYTPYSRYNSLTVYRRGYRTGPLYRTQVGRNATYMRGYGSRYPSSASTFSNPSAARRSYVSRTASSPGFRSRVSSSPNMRARSGTSSSGASSSRSSGFRSGLSSTARSSYSSSRSSSGFRIF
jgi:hypothetical protein